MKSVAVEVGGLKMGQGTLIGKHQSRFAQGTGKIMVLLCNKSSGVTCLASSWITAMNALSGMARCV